jgi:hypothetical protein
MGYKLLGFVVWKMAKRTVNRKAGHALERVRSRPVVLGAVIGAVVAGIVVGSRTARR